MNKFEIASLLERQKMEKVFEKHNIETYCFTDANSYIQYDGYFINKNNNTITFEVKVRNLSSTSYKTTLIEESKLNFLYQKENPFIFVFFNDNKYLVHKIDKNKEYLISTKFAPKQTNGDNSKIEKRMVEIPILEKELFTF